MGGYGCFKLALVTNRFSHAASFSGALSFQDFSPEKPRFGEHQLIGEVFLERLKTGQLVLILLKVWLKKSDKKDQTLGLVWRAGFLVRSQ